MMKTGIFLLIALLVRLGQNRPSSVGSPGITEEPEIGHEVESQSGLDVPNVLSAQKFSEPKNKKYGKKHGKKQGKNPRKKRGKNPGEKLGKNPRKGGKRPGKKQVSNNNSGTTQS